jgi:alpha-tubulin suppressor-like RCC1 family protein/archaellum component FlaF (FlaF/FlaG flagellin family)
MTGSGNRMARVVQPLVDTLHRVMTGKMPHGTWRLHRPSLAALSVIGVAAAVVATSSGSVWVGSVGATTSSSPAGASLSAAATSRPVTFTIDADAGRTTISPLIYGLNDGTNNSSFASDLSTVRPTLIRQGGNAWTAYNWVNNAANGGSDWCFENYNEVSSSTTTGAGVLPTVQADQAAGLTSLVTIPITGYVAANENAYTENPPDECDQADEATDPNNIMNQPNYVATQLDVNNPTDPDPLSTPPTLTGGNVYQDQFVYWLKQSAPKAKVMFSLDNEPDFWRCTHPEVWPTATLTGSTCADPYNGGVDDQEGAGLDYQAFMARELAYAEAIKSVDPNAEVIGPVLGGYSGMLEFQGTDPSDVTNYGDFVDYYLEQVHAADVAAHTTLINAFDFHWYPQIPDVDSTDTSATVVAEREQAPRSLWDPTYVENSWITQCCTNGAAIDLLPWLQGKIATENPGMPLSISEWQYGAGGDISGAIADADALGIFGRYGVHDAAYWPDSQTSFAHGAFEIYRNYNGHGATFGDTEVVATNSDPDMTSVYASIEKANPSHVVIVAINKNTRATPASIVLQHSASSAKAAVYMLTEASATPKKVATVRADGADTFSYLMPAQSVSVIVPTPATSPVLDADSPPTSAPSGVSYSYNFNAAGDPAPTYAVASGSLPTGLTLSSSGGLSGTPTVVRNSSFTVSASNGVAPAAVTPSISIDIYAPVPPTFTSASPPTGTALSPYSYTFVASGSPPPTFALHSGSLPKGLTLSSAGVLSGRPSAVGRSTFTVEASNIAAPSAVSPTLSIIVSPPQAGTVVAWGDGANGELGDGSSANQLTAHMADFPAGTSVTQVAGGTNGGVALTSNGQVYTWGSNASGQLGDNMAEGSSAAPIPVAFPSGTPAVTQVAEGDGFIAVRTADGNVWEWGSNWTGQIGNGSTSGASVNSPTEVSLGSNAGTVTAISAGVDWVEALTTSGNLLAWGNNGAGQLGVATAENSQGVYAASDAPAAVGLGTFAGKITAVSANSYGYGDGGHTLALTNSGAVLAWGNDPNGELGNGTVTSGALGSPTPVLVSPPQGSATLPPIEAISAGYYQNLALTTTGRVLSWGANWDDQLGVGPAGVSNSCDCSAVPVYVSLPAGLPTLPDIAAISANGNQDAIFTTDGTLYSWGTSSTTTDGVTTDYSLGSGVAAAENVPTLVTLPADTAMGAVSSGENFGFAMVGTGS